MKVIIIGGVAGGATAAARIRRHDEQAEIVIYERTGYISYANCGMPYYIGGSIVDKDDLALQTPDSFWNRFRIQVKVRHEVIRIYPGKKSVLVHDLENGREFEDTYDKLILSPGAKPIIPNEEALGRGNVFTLRTVEDTFKIKEFIEHKKPKTAIIAGGGFIGMEMAENLVEQGIQVTLLQRSNQLLEPIDYDMACILHAHMRKKGVNLVFGQAATGLEEADMVILAIGVVPDSSLAKDAGLALGVKGSILVNNRMETSEPDIYAVGDAVEIQHKVIGQKGLISLAGPANKQGRIAADNICGGNSTFKGALGSSVIKVFDMTAASTGINEKTAKRLGISYEKVILTPASHATYYPGASFMTMKVLYEKETLRILGAQIVGYEGVDKRIDVLATAIFADLTALDLKDLDLAYAPPYSSAKDPVNMAGFMIENIETNKVKQFHWDEVEALQRNGSVILLDSRTSTEYSRGHAEGFINIPVDELRDHIEELKQGKPVYVMCQSGLRSYIACRILKQNDIDCYNFSGGYRFYSTIFAR